MAHRDTWVTEADFVAMAANGINAVRLPVGYWALAETAAQVSPFVEQAYLYVDLAMEWGLSNGAMVESTYQLDCLPGLHRCAPAHAPTAEQNTSHRAAGCMSGTELGWR